MIGATAPAATVEQALVDLGDSVDRLFGPNRLETAIEIARAAAPGGDGLVSQTQ